MEKSSSKAVQASGMGWHKKIAYAAIAKCEPYILITLENFLIVFKGGYGNPPPEMVEHTLNLPRVIPVTGFPAFRASKGLTK